MRKHLIAAAALVALTFSAGIAHATPDPDDPGDQRNWPCGVTVGPVSGSVVGTIIGIRGGKPCPPPAPPDEH